MMPLKNDLIRQKLIDAKARWQPMTGGHSNDVWRVGDRVVKLYRKNGDNPIFRNSGKDEANALRVLSGANIAPNYYGMAKSGEGLAVVYAYLDGDHKADPIEVAELLQRVWAQKPPRQFRLSSLTPLDILREGENCNDQLRWTERVSFEHYDYTLPELPVPEPVFLHGDPVIGNILATKDGLRLIDWQCPSFGDPTRDVAIYLSPAMQYLYGSDDIAERVFLAALPTHIADRYVAMRALYLWWMERYCTWRYWQGVDAQDKQLSDKYQQAAKIEADALRSTTKLH